jgi:hypothetical protein
MGNCAWISANASRIPLSTSGTSTFDGRCSVNRTKFNAICLQAHLPYTMILLPWR